MKIEFPGKDADIEVVSEVGDKFVPTYGIETLLNDDPLEYLNCEIRFVGGDYDFGLDPKFDPYGGDFGSVAGSYELDDVVNVINLVAELPDKQKSFIAKWTIGNALKSLKENTARIEEIYTNARLSGMITTPTETQKAMHDMNTVIVRECISQDRKGTIETIVNAYIKAETYEEVSVIADLLDCSQLTPTELVNIRLDDNADLRLRSYAEDRLGRDEGRAKDQLIAPGATSIEYMGREFVLSQPLPNGGRARELLSGVAVLIEDAQGIQRGILHTPVADVKSGYRLESKFYENWVQFAEDWSYGDGIALDRIKDYLDSRDSGLYDEAEILHLEGRNSSSLPLGARVKAFELSQDPVVLPKLDNLILENGEWVLPLLQALDEEDINDFLSVYEGNSDQLGVSLRHLYQLTELSTQYLEADKNDLSELSRLMADKGTQQLREVVSALKSGKDFSSDEWQNIHNASAAPARAITAYNAKLEGKEYSLEKFINSPAEEYYELIDFYRKHPEMNEVFQSNLELFMARFNQIQEGDTFYEEMQNRKLEFYRKYYEIVHSRGTEEIATTVATVDISRGMSVLRSMKEEWGDKAKSLNAFIWGVGAGERFEGPWIEEMEKEGFGIGKMVANDLVDSSENLHPKLKELKDEGNLDYITGNFLEKMGEIEGEFELIVIPWSALADVLVFEDMGAILKKLRSMLAPDGVLIIDMPISLGDNPSAEELQSTRLNHDVPGMDDYSFEIAPGVEIGSTFNIVEPELWVYQLFAEAALMPMNVDPGEHKAIIKEVLKGRGEQNFLDQMRRDGKNLDAMSSFMYQTMSDSGWRANRVSYVVTPSTVSEVRKALGGVGSIYSALHGEN
jgi:hypothetical protein